MDIKKHSKLNYSDKHCISKFEAYSSSTGVREMSRWIKDLTVKIKIVKCFVRKRRKLPNIRSKKQQDTKSKTHKRMIILTILNL